MGKMFYYRVRTTSKTRSGGRLQTAEVYKVVRGKIVKVGEAKWNTGGYKGEQSEVFGLLRRKKLVPAKAYKEGNGYYSWSISEKYNFKIETM